MDSRHRREFGLCGPEGYGEGVVGHARANDTSAKGNVDREDAIRDDADDSLASLAAPAVHEPHDVVRRGDRPADSSTTATGRSSGGPVFRRRHTGEPGYITSQQPHPLPSGARGDARVRCHVGKREVDACRHSRERRKCSQGRDHGCP
jgi:hypothetical protein